MASEYLGIVGAIADLIKLAIEQTGKTTAQILGEVEAENARRAASPKDETEPVSAEIKKNLQE